MIRETTCVEVACDGCEEGWSDDDLPGPPHFESLEEANEFTESHDWRRLLCPRCAALRPAATPEGSA